MAESTFECPSCALDVESGAEVCPYCGYEFPRRASGGFKIVALVVVLLLLWPLVRWLMALFEG